MTRSNVKIRPSLVAATVTALSISTVVALSSAGDAGAASSPNQGPFQLAWRKILNDPRKPIALASPSVGTLDGGGPAAIVGDRAGHIYAYHLSDGSPVAGWPVSTGGVAVDSTASVIGSGPKASVFIGVGTSGNPGAGGFLKLSARGKILGYVHPQNVPSRSATVGVQDSMSVGTLKGRPFVVSGAMGQLQYALDASTFKTLRGFPWFQADSQFDTPATADLYGTGSTMIIEGGDSTGGLAFNKRYVNGGHLRILSPYGNAYTKNPAGGLFCSYDTDQVVQSSPAVGRLLAGGGTGIAFGTGSFWPGARSTNYLTVVNTACRKVWSVNLGGSTGSSPALADVQGNGQLAVLEAANGSKTTHVYALHGSNGTKIWHADVPGNVIGSVATASLNGIYQDALVPTTDGLFVIDGRSGHVLYRIWKNSFMAMQSTPLVTVDPDGTVGLTIAGYTLGPGHRLFGEIQHFKIAGAPATKVTSAGSWPMFHHDPHLTGNASVSQPSGVTFTADTAVNPVAALVPERGSASKRVCLAGGACVTLHVEGRTSTGSTNYGQFGYGYGSVVLDRSSPGAASVSLVSANSALFGTSKRWLTHSNGAIRRPLAASIITAGAAWSKGCTSWWKVRLSYTVYYTNGQSASGLFVGPYFHGFKC